MCVDAFVKRFMNSINVDVPSCFTDARVKLWLHWCWQWSITFCKWQWV